MHDAPPATTTQDATEPSAPAPGTSTRSIAFMNQKGGVGKTTTTVNLAAGIARTGRKTLLIDLDPQAHASLHLGVDPDACDATVYDLLSEPDRPIEEGMQRLSEHLTIIPAETDLAAVETELATVQGRTDRLRNSLARATEHWDFVLFDCPPSLGILTLNALSAAREVLIPMQAHFLALQGVGKLLETVGMVSASANPALQVTGVVLCMHDAQTTHSREVVADLDGFFEEARGSEQPWRSAQVFRPPIRRNIKLAECPSFGQTVFEYAPGCPGAQDYETLAANVISAGEPDSGTVAPPEVVVQTRSSKQVESGS